MLFLAASVQWRQAASAQRVGQPRARPGPCRLGGGRQGRARSPPAKLLCCSASQLLSEIDPPVWSDWGVWGQLLNLRASKGPPRGLATGCLLARADRVSRWR